MNAYFNTPLENLSDEDLKRIINFCNSEIAKREEEHYNNLYENVIESLTEMVKYFPFHVSMVCPHCEDEWDWNDVLNAIKNYYE